jgi:hypothetical protein
MAYRIFISTNDTAECREYLAVVKEALFRMDDFPVSAIEGADVRQTDDNQWSETRRLIESSQVFIGLYSADYGAVPDGHTQSYTEMAYEYAREAGLMCLIFMPESTKNTVDDDRQQTFLEHLRTHHIIHYFSSTDELSAQVRLGVGKIKQTSRHRRRKKLTPPAETRFRDASPPAAPPREEASIEPQTAPDDFDALVERALTLAEDDITSMIRRSLELHDAQHQMQDTPDDGLMHVSPVFGEPLAGSQFQSDIFMIMPFRQRFDDIYTNIVRPVTADLNLTIKRGDDFSSIGGSIMQEVWAALNACRLVIAETTEINPNVYYELGIAHTLGKPTILISQETDVEDIPFDIRHRRFILYKDSIAGGEMLENELRQQIIWLLNDLDESRQNGNDQGN